MRALSVILMAYIIMVALFTKFVPLPFVGSIAGLLVYPFARMVSWRELFEIYLFQHIFVYILNIDALLGSLALVSSYAHGYEAILPLIFPIAILYGAFTSTAMMKIIGVRFKPKMLKRLIT